MIFLYSILTLIALLIFTPMMVVGIALPSKVSLGRRTFQNGKTIDHYDLSDKFKWFQNPEDGLTGDKRGWFWFIYKPKFIPQWIWDSDNFKMWWWSGVRNPFNYLKRKVIGIDIRKFEIVKLIGYDYVRDDLQSQGFQILLAKPYDGIMPRPMLYWVKELHDNKGICFQLGWKIKLEHNTINYSDPLDYFKGVTFELNPYKDLS